MSVEQYCALVRILPQIEAELVSQGEKVPRPEYDGSPGAGEGRDEDEDMHEDIDGKQNIEATSDEDE
jgi:hypothetical protein